MKELLSQEYGAMLNNDILRLFIGELLAQGKYRDVFTFQLDAELVVKIEARLDDNGQAMFCNVAEMDFWCASKDSPLREWLAPCVFISPYGGVLIQRRTTPIRIDQIPALVPSVFSDLKADNWGFYQGRAVVHDYAFNKILNYGCRNFSLVPGEWHDGKGNDIARV